jgi:hypothetical protein
LKKNQATSIATRDMFFFGLTRVDLTLGIYSMQLYHFLDGVLAPFTTPLFWKKGIVSTAVKCTHDIQYSTCHSPFLHGTLVLVRMSLNAIYSDLLHS